MSSTGSNEQTPLVSVLQGSTTEDATTKKNEPSFQINRKLSTILLTFSITLFVVGSSFLLLSSTASTSTSTSSSISDKDGSISSPFMIDDAAAGPTAVSPTHGPTNGPTNGPMPTDQPTALPMMAWRHHFSLCGDFSRIAFADMHDGDIKRVTVEDDTITIQPTNRGEHWEVRASLDTSTCTAHVSFDVPGKPSPPPVPLMVTIWNMERLHSGERKLVFEFTDPSGTIAPSDSPLNHWVQLHSS